MLQKIVTKKVKKWNRSTVAQMAQMAQVAQMFPSSNPALDPMRRVSK